MEELKVFTSNKTNILIKKGDICLELDLKDTKYLQNKLNELLLDKSDWGSSETIKPIYE